MQTDSKNARIARSRYNEYARSRAYSLSDVYGRYSKKKEQAWEYCEQLMEENDGRNLKIISYNQNFFTAGFEYTDKGTGEEMFCYITKGYDRTCVI